MECEGVYWIETALDVFKWWTVVAINFWVP
jgi:hypothetical protein